MPDTAINTGNPARHARTGVFRIFNSAGSTSYAPAYVRTGTLKIEEGGYEAVPVDDNGTLSSVVLSGDPRESKIMISFRASKAGITGATDLRSLTVPADASNKKTLYKIEVEFPDSPGAATGMRGTFNNCYLPDPAKFSANGGADTDTLEFTFHSRDTLGTWATY